MVRGAFGRGQALREDVRDRITQRAAQDRQGWDADHGHAWTQNDQDADESERDRQDAQPVHPFPQEDRRQDRGPDRDCEFDGEDLGQGNERDAVEPAVLSPEVGDVAQQMRAEYARSHQRPARTLQQQENDNEPNQAAEEQNLERRQLRRELAPRNGHRHEGNEGARHPERSSDHRRKGLRRRHAEVSSDCDTGKNGANENANSTTCCERAKGAYARPVRGRTNGRAAGDGLVAAPRYSLSSTHGARAILLCRSPVTSPKMHRPPSETRSDQHEDHRPSDSAAGWAGAA